MAAPAPLLFVRRSECDPPQAGVASYSTRGSAGHLMPGRMVNHGDGTVLLRCQSAPYKQDQPRAAFRGVRRHCGFLALGAGLRRPSLFRRAFSLLVLAS